MKKWTKYLRLTTLGLVAAMIISSIPFSKSESYLRSTVVKLSSDRGMCSGEQIEAPSGTKYILTAAHCKLLQHEGKILVTTYDGRKLERMVIAEDPYSDLLLLEGVPGIPALKIADKASLGRIRTFTHGSDMSTWKSEGETLESKFIKVPLKIITSPEEAATCNQPKNEIEHAFSFFGDVDICFLSVEETAMTAFITPGSSGGEVVNDQGELVGVVSASNGSFGFIVTLKDIKKFVYNY